MSLVAREHPVSDRPAPGGVRDHVVQFCDDEAYLAGSVATFVEAGLSKGQPVVIIATEPHREALCRRLLAKGVAVDALCSSGQLLLRDAAETLSTFLVDGMPDWQRFSRSIGGLLEKGAQAAAKPVRAYGEMVDLLWRSGNPQAAIRLEELWNDLSASHSFTLLCAYRSSELARLQERARALERENEQRKKLESELRIALDQRRHVEEALRDTQEQLVDFFDNAAEGLQWVGSDGTVLRANRAQLELLGYREDEYVGHNIVEFHADRRLIEDILGRLSRNETLRNVEAPLRCKDGAIKHVVIHSNALFEDGQFVHTRCFTRDISDRKRLEDELRRQNDELSRTVHFSEMFVGILGHDLRNPLSAITTAASLLSRRADSDKVARPATRILSSAARMARMIDQLLDFTRIRLGKGIPLSRSQIDLAEVCRIATDELDSSEAPRLELHLSGNAVGSWDGDRLTQLVSNLVGNALAHGSRAAPVKAAIDGTHPDQVILTVQNAGAIPPDVLPVIFEPFRSTKDRKEDQSSGLGLGLYIGQQIVLAHAGSIEVRSSEESGTCFTVRLPRTAAPR